MNPEITSQYGNQVRVRVCGLCWKDGGLLMVNHRGLTHGDFWAPPGGGLEFGNTVHECLQKEFLEETGLRITIKQFLFACEFVKNPLHAIELFFEVEAIDGNLQKGDDPELAMIEEVLFMQPEEIARVPIPSLHGIFGLVPTPEDLKTLTGFFRI